MMHRTIPGLVLVSSLALGCTKVPDAPAAQSSEAHASTTGAAPSAPSAAAETLPLDPAASRVEFTGAKITATHEGGFRDVRGTITLDPANLLASRIEVRVATASLFIDNPRLQTHLTTPDFFDVARFPEATFRSTAIVAGGAGGATHTITGDLTIHGQTKSLSFPITVEVSPTAVHATSTTQINRRDFGIVYPGMPDDLIRDEVNLRIDLRAPRTPR